MPWTSPLAIGLGSRYLPSVCLEQVLFRLQWPPIRPLQLSVSNQLDGMGDTNLDMQRLENLAVTEWFPYYLQKFRARTGCPHFCDLSFRSLRVPLARRYEDPG